MRKNYHPKEPSLKLAASKSTAASSLKMDEASLMLERNQLKRCISRQQTRNKEIAKRTKELQREYDLESKIISYKIEKLSALYEKYES